MIVLLKANVFILSRLLFPQLAHLVHIDCCRNLELHELICNEPQVTDDHFNVGRPRDPSVFERDQMPRLLLCNLLVLARCGWMR